MHPNLEFFSFEDVAQARKRLAQDGHLMDVNQGLDGNVFLYVSYGDVIQQMEYTFNSVLVQLFLRPTKDRAAGVSLQGAHRNADGKFTTIIKVILLLYTHLYGVRLLIRDR